MEMTFLYISILMFTRYLKLNILKSLTPDRSLLLLLLLLSCFSCVQLCATPQKAAHQALPSLGFSRQEHWNGLHFLLQCIKVKSESEVVQSYPTLNDPWTAAYQAPPSMGFSRQEYWSRVPLPSPDCSLSHPKTSFSHLSSSQFQYF